MEVIIENLELCEDCTQVSVNCDYSGLQYSYDEKEIEQRIIEIDEGLERLGAGLCWQGIDGIEFSLRKCDCCLSKLAGRREYFVVIK